MTIGIFFWVIALICVVFGLWSSRQPLYAPYAPWPMFVLILLLGWQVFGPALHR